MNPYKYGLARSYRCVKRTNVGGLLGGIVHTSKIDKGDMELGYMLINGAIYMTCNNDIILDSKVEDHKLISFWTERGSYKFKWNAY